MNSDSLNPPDQKTINEQFLALAAQLVAENKELRAELAQLRTLTKANGVGLHRLSDRVERLEDARG